MTFFSDVIPGKKYRTKKERLRFERDGPPLLADGSLDYTESAFDMRAYRYVC